MTGALAAGFNIEFALPAPIVSLPVPAPVIVVLSSSVRIAPDAFEVDIDGAVVGDLDAVKRGAVTGAVAASFDIEFALSTDRQRAGTGAGDRGVVVEREDRAGCVRIDIDGGVVGDLDAVQRGAVAGAVAAGFNIEFVPGADRQLAGAGSSDRSVVVERDLRLSKHTDVAGIVRRIGGVADRGVLDGQLAVASRSLRSSRY